MTLYVGGGYVCEGATGYEDGDDVAPDYDAYDWEDDYPSPRPKKKRTPGEEGAAAGGADEGGAAGGGGAGGEKVGREEQGRTREHPQFAKRYTVEVDRDKLREALEWMVTRPETAGAFRWDDIHDKHGEVAGMALWIGFGPDVTPGAIHDGLYEAFSSVGVDISQTLIGSDNLRRGLERDGGRVKQSFFRIFIPEPGWKLLQDWTILREGETKESVRPELQTMVRDRQRSRRLEIIQVLKDIRVAEVRAAELAREKAAREAAEAEARRLREELERQDRALASIAQAMAQPKPTSEAMADELAALMRGEIPQGWGGAVRRAQERLEHPPPPPPPPPVAEVVDRAVAEAARGAAELARQRPARAPSAPPPLPPPEAPPPPEEPRAVPLAPEPKKKPKKKPRPTAAERRAAHKAEAKRLDARARRLELRAGRSRTKQANADRREAKELRAQAAELKEKAKR